MAAVLSFYAVGDSFTTALSGSGLGFYGASFGSSVEVNEYQTTTYVTDANGTIQGPLADNVRFMHQGVNDGDPGSGLVSSGPMLPLKEIPNKEATLNIRFTNDSAVKTQNVNLLIYDRVGTSSNASGVTTKVAELIHVNTVQGATGSGDAAWHTASGSEGVPATIPLAQSPGQSGVWAGNGVVSEATDMRHDWYVALSASPDSIGSKTNYGLYVSLEYL
jgi:hypothetical protein